MHIEFADDLLRAFCEQLTGPVYPWESTVHRPLMVRIQRLDAAIDERDIVALRSLNYTAVDTSRGNIRIDDAHRLQIEFLPGPPVTVSIQGLTQAPPPGVRNV